MEEKVFMAGTWKGKPYTNEDLQNSAKAYERARVTAPWTVGHEITNGQAAAGWIRSLVYRESPTGVGELWALSDFNALGQKIIAEETHKNKSISFYPPDSPYNPEPGAYFVRHVAMLGAEMPALTGLGMIGTTDFSEGVPEDLLEYNISPDLFEADSYSFTMNDFETIKASLQALAHQVAVLTKAMLEDQIEDIGENEPAAADVAIDEAAVCAACGDKPKPMAEEMSKAVIEEMPKDYKALYEAAQEELTRASEANASVSLAQVVESYYNEGILSEDTISAKDLTLCLTKLSLGHDNFSDAESPATVINALIKALQEAKPGYDIPLGEETDSFSAEEEGNMSIDDQNELGDAFYSEAEKVAKDFGLSFSQGMSALLSAKEVAKANGIGLQRALKEEAGRFKVSH